MLIVRCRDEHAGCGELPSFLLPARGAKIFIQIHMDGRVAQSKLQPVAHKPCTQGNTFISAHYNFMIGAVGCMVDGVQTRLGDSPPKVRLMAARRVSAWRIEVWIR